MRHLYNLVLYLMLPGVVLRLFWRSRALPAYRQRLHERFGQVGSEVAQGGLWVHAVSFGEVQAVAPLLQDLLRQRPQLPIFVTTTTPTGSALVEKLFGDQVAHSYMPYDLMPFLQRFLDSVKPVCLLMVETEVWPNLLLICRRRGVRTLLANARLSERSLRRYLKLRGFAHQVFSQIDQVAAQTDEDAQRLCQLGVPSNQISVTGSIKFDMQIPASVEERVEVMRLGWGARPVWVAASTHEGEEEIVLATHQMLLRRLPQALLVLVPRHPERFPRVLQLLNRSGLRVAQRTQCMNPGSDIQIYLGDTMGELPVILGSADAAFIGGSLVAVGGHNVLEAAAQGVPVCFGPHTFNFALISRMLLDCSAARRVKDAEELAAVLYEWLSDAHCRAAAGEAGRAMVLQNRGALERLRKLLDQMLNPL